MHSFIHCAVYMDIDDVVGYIPDRSDKDKEMKCEGERERGQVKLP